MLTRFRELKLEMNASREAERKNLTTLTLQSDTAMKALQRTKEKVTMTLGQCLMYNYISGWLKTVLKDL